jgi:hypothetical protein
MSALLSGTRLGRLTLILGLALMAPALAPASGGAKPPPPPTQQLDRATATGASQTPPPGLGAVIDIDINAFSGPSGENPGGSVSFDILINRITHPEPFPLNISGPVTCLNVSGNAALINADTSLGPVTVELVDNGGGGLDGFGVGYGNASADCSSFPSGVFEFPYDHSLGAGRAVVFDAQPFPTTKFQCRNGGWARFGFKNQGQCLVFVLEARVCKVLERFGLKPRFCPARLPPHPAPK